jgi:(1->4)-alpha-D-glucan 1-alpha-D-glucosylmutase
VIEQLTDLVDQIVRRVRERQIAPRATYRLQLTAQFPLSSAAQIVPYLADLGISHLYLSPYLKSRPGSAHGYDVCDHGSIDPELGGEEGHAALIAALQTAALGHIVDIVPNHVSASSFNPWWMDVLENGPNSPYSGFFDIDWLPVKGELAGKVLLPILGEQYGEVLENGQLVLTHAEGAFFVRYFEHMLPLGPTTILPLLKHRVDELRHALGPASEECLEYESILTSVENLPSHLDTLPEAVTVRQREKEVIKRRLRELEARAPAVAEFVAKNVAEFSGQPGHPSSFDRLDGLLAAQAYRLCHWRAASDEINYRRFFDTNELAALCMESPQVFYRAHALIGRLLGQRGIDGLRIDHIDGLLAPEQYLWRLAWLCLAEVGRSVFEEHPPPPVGHGLPTDWPAVAVPVLQAACEALNLPQPQAADLEAVLGSYTPISAAPPGENVVHESGPAAVISPVAENFRPASTLYVVVEKILGPDEPLPASWPTAGTTGYDFLKALGGLFVDPEGWNEIQRIYERFVGQRMDFGEIVHAGKLVILRFSMASELQMLAHRLNRISEQHRRSRDFTLNMLRHALREILANFPVYRTYASPAGVSERDRRFVNLALARAKRRNPAADLAVFDFVREVLLLQHPDGLKEQAIHQREVFTGRFQQVTSPVMAKGVEDTAFYVYCPLISVNEVGGDPRAPTTSPADFHRENSERLSQFPQALLATSTHDTKRSEDVRARISVLAEMPGRWKQAVNRWARLNRRHRQDVDGLPAPGPSDEYVLYQTLVGVWPLTPPGAEELRELTNRLQQYMEKATREAKQQTSWLNPNAAYDAAMRSFVAATLTPGKKNRFLARFQEFHEQVVDYGLYSALSQTVLKLTSPGVPDIYQGQELWDFSLVDPDNRRPVDYNLRRWLLGETQAAASQPEKRAALAAELAVRPRDSRSKLFVSWRLLTLRREFPELFSCGDYLPLDVHGMKQRHVVAFARTCATGDPLTSVVVIVPRLIAQLLESRSWEPGQPRSPLGEPVWLDTEVTALSPLSGSFCNVFTNESIYAQNGAIRVADALRSFPVAVLVSRPSPG